MSGPRVEVVRRPGVAPPAGRPGPGGLAALALLGAAALAATLAGCGGDPPGRGLSVRVASNPFGVSLFDNGRLVVAEDAHARLRYELASNGNMYTLTRVIAHRGDSYRVATNEPGRTATVTVVPRRGGIRIALALHPTAGVAQVYDSFDTIPGEHFLGGGEREQAVDLTGQVLPVKVSNVCAYAPVPFFASSAGWGLRLASQNVSALAFPGSGGGGGCQFGGEPQCAFPPLASHAEVCVKGARLDEDLYVGSIPQVLRDYEADAGEPAVPPPSELELIKWRGRAVFTGPGDLLADIQRFQAAGIPLGWVLLDDVWESCIGTLTFDPSAIRDPRTLIREVHARGVRLMLWVAPRANCDLGYPPGSVLGPPSNQELDLRKPDVAAQFEARLRRLFALGIDGLKVDRGDEVDLEGVSESLDNEYPLLLARAVMAALPRGDAAIFRAGAMGSQGLVPGIWAGDQSEQWSGLEQAIVAAQTAGMSGFSTWGSDIGGYDAPPGVTADLFARWAQLGAVSPVMEVGGSGQNSTPWTLGSGAMAALRGAAVLHYELFPYLYGLLARHRPVLAPLAYLFPGDAHSWASPYELLVGPDLLAAPVTGPGVTPSVYLPPGRWVDLFSGAEVNGGGPTFTRPTPLSQFPLYARAGSVLPFNLRTTSGSWWGLNELVHPGRAGYLATDGARLDLTGLPHQVQLFVPAPAPPRRVTLGGRPVRWSWNAGPLPGVVVRTRGPVVRGRIVLSGPRS